MARYARVQNSVVVEAIDLPAGKTPANIFANAAAQDWRAADPEVVVGWVDVGGVLTAPVIGAQSIPSVGLLRSVRHHPTRHNVVAGNSGLFPVPGGGIYTVSSNTLVGDEILVSNPSPATVATALGHRVFNTAGYIYCGLGVGFRSAEIMADGQYFEAVAAADALKHGTYARNATAISSKAGLYLDKIESSFIAGTGVAYDVKELLNVFAVGPGALDGGSPPPTTLAEARARNRVLANVHVEGLYAGRRVNAAFNMFSGQNAASLTNITGQYNHGDGRSCFSQLEAGIGNTAGGDSSGVNVRNANFTTYYGFQNGAPVGGGDWSNAGGFGYGSGLLLTGPNQIQIGGAGTVPYAQAALVVRSDKRDKINPEPLLESTAEAIVLDANWLTFQLNPREAYIDQVMEEVEVEEQVLVDVPRTVRRKDGTRVDMLGPNGLPLIDRKLQTIKRKEMRSVIRNIDFGEDEADNARRLNDALIKNDGSKAGRRRHAGVFAQDEAERLEKRGIDFAGLKYGAKDGLGADKWGLQYEQYIPHLAVIARAHRRELQEKQALITALTERLDNLAAKIEKLANDQ
jgi:hypothetical protein